jgi:hypothetical protein
MAEGMIVHMVGAGKTTPGATNWVQYSTPDGIYVDVDTSAAGFGSKTVIYTTSLAGDTSHWVTTGGSCVYLPTNKGFRIYVKNPGAITPQQANSMRWHVTWIGIEID